MSAKYNKMGTPLYVNVETLQRVPTPSLLMSTTYGYSLVPRPFPPPVFHCLQCANMEGEGLGDLVPNEES